MKKYNIFIAVLSIIIGVRAIQTGRIGYLGASVNVESVRYHYGVLFILIGIVILFFILKTKFLDAKYYKCTSCGEITSKTGTCAECGGSLEPLESFYKKRPYHKTKWETDKKHKSTNR